MRKSRALSPISTSNVAFESDIMASQPPREPTASQQALDLTVGVMGVAGHDIPESHLAKAEELGEVIGEQGCVLVTGACPGLPFAAARGAKRKGATVIGISPGLSLYEHAYKYESPNAYHDILISPAAV